MRIAKKGSATLRQLKGRRILLQVQPMEFHHVLGVLDGKHIRIRCPASGESQFYNYMGYHSIVLLALVDASYRFTWIQVLAPGAASDAQLWNESTLRHADITNSIDIPELEPLPGDDRPIPYFIIGDDASLLSTSGWWSRSLQHLWNRTSILQLSPFSHQTMRWECLWYTGQSMGLHTHNPSTRAAEFRDHGECVYYTSWSTAGADDDGCWSWHTLQSASEGIYSHVLVSKGNRR